MNKKLLLTGMVIFLLLHLVAGCDYARMTNDEGYDTYETWLPLMPPDSVSVTGGTTALRLADPRELSNPFEADARHLEAGRLSYGYFCTHCHGPRGNGIATVGQSFAPLPTDLTSQQVRSQGDGELYKKIALGFRRHPPLVHTMMAPDIWNTILYMRHLPSNGK